MTGSPQFRCIAVAFVVFLDAAPIAGRDAPPLPDPGPSDGGWIESAGGRSPKGSWIAAMSAVFRVPDMPPARGQLLYVFPALEPAQGARILQPVLRLSDDGWSLASFRVVDQDGEHSSFVHTEPGHTIRGTMRGESCSADGACTWTITTADVTTGESTTLTVDEPVPYTRYVTGALEAYHVTSCGQYPREGLVRFENVVVRDRDDDDLPVAPEQWTSQEATPECGFGTKVGANEGVVTLFFDRGCPIGC